MLTIGLLKEILNEYNKQQTQLSMSAKLFSFTPGIIRIIQSIITENTTTTPDTLVTTAELCALTKEWSANPACIDPYYESLSFEHRLLLKDAVKIFSCLSQNNMLTQENVVLLVLPERVKFLRDCISDPFASKIENLRIVVKHLSQHVLMKKVITALKKYTQLKLTDLCGIEADDGATIENFLANIDSINSEANDISAFILQHISQYALWQPILVFLTKLNKLTVKNLEAADYPLLMSRDEAMRYLSLISKTVDNTFSFAKCGQEVFDLLIEHPTYSSSIFKVLRCLDSSQIAAAVALFRKHKLHGKSYIDSFSSRNLEQIGKLSPAKQTIFFRYLDANSQYVQPFFMYIHFYDSIMFLLNSRPKLHETIFGGINFTEVAHEILVTLGTPSAKDIDFIIHNLKLTLSIQRCLQILQKSNLSEYYGNIMECAVDPEQLKMITDALNFVSHVGYNVISQQTFAIAWHSAPVFAKAYSKNVHTVQDVELVLSHPAHVEIIVNAIIISATINRGQYDSLIVKYPKQSEVLLKGIKEIYSSTNTTEVERAKIIEIFTDHLEHAETLAKAYFCFRDQQLDHNDACNRMRAHPRYALDIAEAMSKINSSGLPSEMKELYITNIPNELEGKLIVGELRTEPVQQTEQTAQAAEQVAQAAEQAEQNKRPTMDQALLIHELTKLNCDYGNFLIGNLHATQKFSSDEYFYNSCRFYQKVPPKSPWYFSAQRGLLHVLVNALDGLQNDGSEIVAEIKSDLAKAATILRTNNEGGAYLTMLDTRAAMHPNSVTSIPPSFSPEKPNEIATQTPSVSVKTITVYSWPPIKSAAAAAAAATVNAAAHAASSHSTAPGNNTNTR